MANHQVNLPGQLDEFVKRSVEAGLYTDASDVMRAGLRLLQQQEAKDHEKLQVLRRLAVESLSSVDRGEFVEVNLDGLDRFLDQIDSKVTNTRTR